MLFRSGPASKAIESKTLVQYLGGKVVSDPWNTATTDILPIGLCPSGRRDGLGAWGAVDTNAPNNSYAFNTYYTTLAGASSHPERWTKPGRAKNASYKYFISDYSSLNYLGASYAAGQRTFNWSSDYISRRHTDGGNVGFLDSHVEYVKHSELLSFKDGSLPAQMTNYRWHDAQW